MEVSFAVAFFSGIISFFAPCVIPLLPAYLSFITGISVKELMEKRSSVVIRKKVLFTSIAYTLGFSLFFVLLGTAAAGIGSPLRQHKDLLYVGSGLIIVLLSLSLIKGISLTPHLLSSLNLPGWIGRVQYLKAFVLGTIFALIWIPCAGAVLGAILTLAALSSTALEGALLLFVFSIGISIPFIILGMTISHSMKLIQKLRPILPVVMKLSGLVLLLLGLLLINNTLQLGPHFLTYNFLNGWLFQLAYQFGYRF